MSQGGNASELAPVIDALGDLGVRLIEAKVTDASVIGSSDRLLLLPDVKRGLLDGAIVVEPSTRTGYAISMAWFCNQENLVNGDCDAHEVPISELNGDVFRVVAMRVPARVVHFEGAKWTPNDAGLVVPTRPVRLVALTAPVIDVPSTVTTDMQLILAAKSLRGGSAGGGSGEVELKVATFDPFYNGVDKSSAESVLEALTHEQAGLPLIELICESCAGVSVVRTGTVLPVHELEPGPATQIDAGGKLSFEVRSMLNISEELVTIEGNAEGGNVISGPAPSPVFHMQDTGLMWHHHRQRVRVSVDRLPPAKMYAGFGSASVRCLDESCASVSWGSTVGPTPLQFVPNRLIMAIIDVAAQMASAPPPAGTTPYGNVPGVHCRLELNTDTGVCESVDEVEVCVRGTGVCAVAPLVEYESPPPTQHFDTIRKDREQLSWNTLTESQDSGWSNDPAPVIAELYRDWLTNIPQVGWKIVTGSSVALPAIVATEGEYFTQRFNAVEQASLQSGLIAPTWSDLGGLADALALEGTSPADHGIEPLAVERVRRRIEYLANVDPEREVRFNAIDAAYGRTGRGWYPGRDEIRMGLGSEALSLGATVERWRALGSVVEELNSGIDSWNTNTQFQFAMATMVSYLDTVQTANVAMSAAASENALQKQVTITTLEGLRERVLTNYERFKGQIAQIWECSFDEGAELPCDFNQMSQQVTVIGQQCQTVFDKIVAVIESIASVFSGAVSGLKGVGAVFSTLGTTDDAATVANKLSKAHDWGKKIGEYATKVKGWAKDADNVLDKVADLPRECEGSGNEDIVATIRGLQTAIATSAALLDSLETDLATLDAMILSLNADMRLQSTNALGLHALGTSAGSAQAALQTYTDDPENTRSARDAVVESCHVTRGNVDAALRELHQVSHSLQTTAGYPATTAHIEVPGAAGVGDADPLPIKRYSFWYSLWDEAMFSTNLFAIGDSGGLIKGLERRAERFRGWVCSESGTTATDAGRMAFTVRHSITGQELVALLGRGELKFRTGLAALVAGVAGKDQLDIAGATIAKSGTPYEFPVSPPVLLSARYQAFAEECPEGGCVPVAHPEDLFLVSGHGARQASPACDEWAAEIAVGVARDGSAAMFTTCPIRQRRRPQVIEVPRSSDATDNDLIRESTEPFCSPTSMKDVKYEPALGIGALGTWTVVHKRKGYAGQVADHGFPGAGSAIQPAPACPHLRSCLDDVGIRQIDLIFVVGVEPVDPSIPAPFQAIDVESIAAAVQATPTPVVVPPRGQSSPSGSSTGEREESGGRSRRGR